MQDKKSLEFRNLRGLMEANPFNKLGFHFVSIYVVVLQIYVI